MALSLKESGLEYLDLMLIHAPYGGPQGRKGAWKALVESVEEGFGFLAEFPNFWASL